MKSHYCYTLYGILILPVNILKFIKEIGTKQGLVNVEKTQFKSDEVRINSVVGNVLYFD